MSNPQMVMYEKEFNQIHDVVDRLVRDAGAKVAFIADKNRQLIVASGDVNNLDITSLASLAAGNIAGMGGMTEPLKENEFATQFYERDKADIHIQLVHNRVILGVIFDSQSKSELVRLRAQGASDELNQIFETLLAKMQDDSSAFVGSVLTDEDIDNLFNDGPPMTEEERQIAAEAARRAAEAARRREAERAERRSREIGPLREKSAPLLVPLGDFKDGVRFEGTCPCCGAVGAVRACRAERLALCFDCYFRW